MDWRELLGVMDSESGVASELQLTSVVTTTPPCSR